MRLTKSHIKEITWIAAGQATTFLGGVAGIKILTNLLTPDQYGTLALALTFAVLSQQVWAGPLQQAVNRNVSPYLQSGRLPELIATGTSVYLGAASILLLILISGIFATSFFLHLSAGLQRVLILGALLAAIQPAFELPQGIYVQLRQRRSVALYQATAALARPLAAAALIVTCGANAMWAILGILLVMLLLAGLQGRHVIQLSKGGRASTNLAWSLVRFAAPYLSWGMLSWGVTAGDRWILKATTTTAVVGLYVVAAQLSTIVPRLASQLISSFVIPILNEIAGFGTEKHRLRRAISMNLIVIAVVSSLGVIGAIGMAVFGKPLLTLLTGPRYSSAAFGLPWLFAGSTMYEVGYLCFNIGPLLYQPHAFMVPRIVAYGITLCLMGLFSLHWGFEGMVSAYFIGAMVHLSATGATAIRLYKEVLGRKSQGA